MSGGVALFMLAAAVAVALRNLPTPEELFSRRVVESTKIYDRTGAVLLYEIHGEEKRTVVPFSEIPASVKNATIAVEDANFYEHGGIDFRGIARAFITNIRSGALRQGGSTITQQLVKKALVGDARTLTRKIKEAVLAMNLEARLDKESILNFYLNQIPYGSNAYGIEAAAQTFFGKHARDLTIAESSLLASLPRAPSYYSPYGQHKDELLRRKDYAIQRLRELGYISEKEALQAKSEELRFLPPTKNIRAPHFVMFVRDYLREHYGDEEVEQGGLVVTTTLDWTLQEEAEKQVRTGAERNEKLIAAKNMALVAINPKNGDILSMVGSRDYFDVARDGNFNVATALRQPGSAFKPFVYATAFRKGLTTDTVLFDAPTEFNPLCSPNGEPRPGAAITTNDCYHPQNYDETFRGPVTLRQAIAQSLNVPSVKVLYLAGIDDSIKTAEDFGITSLGDRNRFGLSLVLGGAEVRLLEMTSAYGVFANDGVLNRPTAILKVATTNGKILEEKEEGPRPILDPEIARTINDVLSDNDARVPVFQPRSSLYFADRRVAVKTGTTQDYRDAWTVGYTPTIAVGVWAGNNDNAPMRQKGSGVMAAAPTWHSFIEFALKNFLPEEFPPSSREESSKAILKGVWQGDVVVTIDTVSGKRATDRTPPETRKDVAYGEPHDPLFWLDRSDLAGPPPQNPARDPQYPNWEASFKQWLGAARFSIIPLSQAPQGFDDVHTVEKQPRVVIDKKMSSAAGLVLEIRTTAAYPIREISVLIGETAIVSRRNPPPIIAVTIPNDTIPVGASLEVRAYDQVGNTGVAFLEMP